MRLLLLAMLVIGCGASPAASASPEGRTVTGTVTFTGSTVGHTDCHGVGAFADMAGGTDVLVLDGTGATIGKGQMVVGPESGDGHCVFTFGAAVPDVPFYTFRVGDRDAPTYSAADMAAMGWTVELAVGD